LPSSQSKVESKATSSNDNNNYASINDNSADGESVPKKKEVCRSGPPKHKGNNIFGGLVDKHGRAGGYGGRKKASAVVFIKPGNGEIMVNGKLHTEYFRSWIRRMELVLPFAITQTLTKFDAWATVRGGGLTGQSRAVQMGISRALVNWDPRYYPFLDERGLLTSDTRQVERKKPGQKKARKKFAWVRR